MEDTACGSRRYLANPVTDKVKEPGGLLFRCQAPSRSEESGDGLLQGLAPGLDCAGAGIPGCALHPGWKEGLPLLLC